MGRGAVKAVVGKPFRRAGATLARYRERDGDHYAADVLALAGVGLALAVAAYSGWSWISNVRDAVTAMLGQERTPRPLLRGIAADVPHRPLSGGPHIARVVTGASR